MSKYYCLIAGLPTITLDDTKPTFTVAEFTHEIEPELSVADKDLLRWYLLKYDNLNLLASLRNQALFDEKGVYTEADLKDICEMMENEDRPPQSIDVPTYFITFIREYFARFETTETFGKQSLDDRLSALYYNEATDCDNEFLAEWFALNLNIGNIMTAANCRKYGLDPAQYIIGDNELASQLRKLIAQQILPTTNSQDYLNELLMISEEKDLMMREKRLDVLRWNWLEDYTYYKTFDIEALITYILRLEMIERWITLDKAGGEQTFRKLVGGMKRESQHILKNFKDNNK
ncbi:MAG: DUF2764 domain-containing protein [Tannerella sp.]|jgi:hypothetical protein|nr:DUF2764 domain-containing protein [Tannerella sp.]